MSLTCGFFNALNHDRRYDALTVSRLFDGMIVDGVYSTIGDKFIVKASVGMTVTVGSGRCWFDHTWTYNDTELPVTDEISDQIRPRIDALVLEVNHEEEVRENTIKFIQGQPNSVPARPTLIKTEYVKQYPLAYILIPADSSEITQDNITNMVGTSECPFATALLEHVTTDELVLQWAAQWQIFMTGYESRFRNWAAGLRDVLDENAAGHLQNEIDGLEDCITYVEYFDETQKNRVYATRNYVKNDTVIVNYGKPISPVIYKALFNINAGEEIIGERSPKSNLLFHHSNNAAVNGVTINMHYDGTFDIIGTATDDFYYSLFSNEGYTGYGMRNDIIVTDRDSFYDFSKSDNMKFVDVTLIGTPTKANNSNPLVKTFGGDNPTSHNDIGNYWIYNVEIDGTIYKWFDLCIHIESGKTYNITDGWVMVREEDVPAPDGYTDYPIFNVEETKVMNRINEAHKVKEFLVPANGWSSASISKWGQSLYYNAFGLGAIYTDPGSDVELSLSGGYGPGSGATPAIKKLFTDVIGAEINDEMMTCTLYSTKIITSNFYVTLKGVE